MESVLRAAVIYFFLVVIFRIAGRRSLSEMSNFETGGDIATHVDGSYPVVQPRQSPSTGSPGAH